MALRPVKIDPQTHVWDVKTGDVRKLTEADREKLASLRERVEKILRKANGRGVTDSERQTFMAMAVNMAQRNGLDLYQIEREMAGGKSAVDAFVVRIADIPDHANWTFLLYNAIAHALCVRIITWTGEYESKPNKRSLNTIRHRLCDYVSLVGLPQDIEMADYLFEYLHRQLEKLATEAYKRNRAMARAEGFDVNGKAYRDNFYRGAVNALGVRVKEMFTVATPLEDDGEGVPANMALMPLKEADVEAAKDKFFPPENLINRKANKAKPPKTVDDIDPADIDPYADLDTDEVGDDEDCDEWDGSRKKNKKKTRVVHEFRQSARRMGYEAGKSIDIRKGINGDAPVAALEAAQ